MLFRSGKLPPAQQARARRLGLVLAMLMRIALLASLAWIIQLTAPLFTVLGRGISGRDLILLANHVLSTVDALISSRLTEAAGRSAAVRTTLIPGRADMRFSVAF